MKNQKTRQELDLASYRFELAVHQAKQPHRSGEPFLKGPIPLSWVTAATRLPGRCLAAGMVLWHLSGLTGKSKVKPTGSHWRKFGMERRSVYKALSLLEKEGLIRVERAPGRNPIVTLLKARPGECKS